MKPNVPFQEEAFDKQFRELIQSETKVSVQDSFTEAVMERLAEERFSFSYQPVISRKGWMFIAVFVLLIVLITILQPSTNTFILFDFSFASNLSLYFSSFIKMFSMQDAIVSEMVQIIFGLFVVLGLQYIIAMLFGQKIWNRILHS